MTTVKQVLDKKGHEVHSISPDASVFDALSTMAEHNIGSLVVLDNANLVGIITERHYSREIVLKGKTSPTTRVRDIMSTEVVCARPDQSVEECMAIMTRQRIRHLPVVEDGSVIGVLSIGDLVKAKIEEQEHQIEQLQNYITTA